jgi:hypothetical protein
MWNLYFKISMKIEGRVFGGASWWGRRKERLVG